FEVASVRAAPPLKDGAIFFGPPRGGPGSNSPQQITWSGAALRSILVKAFDIQGYQLEAPDWMATAQYDILAKVPEGTTEKQANIMWQNLLKERFGLEIHHTLKEFDVDELTIAKGGSKLAPTTLPADAEPFSPANGPPKFGKDGTPEFSGSGAIT